MAATYVDSSQAVGSTVAVPTGYQAGDIMVAWGVDIENPPDGTWTQRMDVGGLGIFIRVWTKTAGSSEGSGGNYAFLNAGATPNLTVACVRNAFEVPSDTDNAFNTDATAVAPSVDVQSPGGLLLIFFGANGATLTGTPSGMTQRENSGPDQIELWTQSVSSGATGTRSNSLSGAAFWLTMPVALRSTETAAISTTATASGTATGGSSLASTPSTTATVSGALGHTLDATVSTTATVTSTVSGQTALAATTSTTASVAGAVSGVTALEAAPSTTASITGALDAPGDMEADLSTTATLSGAMDAPDNLAATLSTTASLAATPGAIVSISAALATSASLSANNGNEDDYYPSPDVDEAVKSPYPPNYVPDPDEPEYVNDPPDG